MGPWDFLLKPTNIIIAALLIAAGLSSGIAYYMYHQNLSLHEQLAVQKRENQIYVDTHNQQIKLLTATIDGQNASIDAFKKSGDKQVDNMRVTAEQQLAELRKKNTSNYTCDQSIQFLVDQSKVLTWGAAK
jgi:uncharacterized protein HemX